MGLKEFWKGMKLPEHYEHMDRTIKSIPSGIGDNPKMPADQFMKAVRSVTELPRTTELFEVFAPKEGTHTKPMQCVAREMALFINNASRKMPAEAVMDMTDHILTNSNLRTTAQKYPESMIETLIHLIKYAKPEDHLNILAKLDRDGTILKGSIENSPEGYQYRAADFFLGIANAGTDKKDTAQRLHRIQISPAFQAGNQQHEFYDYINSKKPGLLKNQKTPKPEDMHTRDYD